MNNSRNFLETFRNHDIAITKHIALLKYFYEGINII